MTHSFNGETFVPEVKTPVLVNLSDVVSEQVGWIWNLRVPRGKLTLMEGDPGQGKSWCCLAIAAAVSKGTSLPGEASMPAKEPENVLLLTAEDGLADTIRPRLEGMGADLTKIFELAAVRTKNGAESPLSIDEDIPALEEVMMEKPYGLIIIDPLNAYIGDVNTHKDSDVRRVLSRLTKLAENYNVAVIGIRHLTKSTMDRAIYRGQGSIAFTATARIVQLVGSHPNNKDERVMAPIKNNLTEAAPSILFSITKTGFLWKGECDLTAANLMGTGDESAPTNHVREDAKEFLREVLSNGPKSAREIIEESKDAGLSWTTLKRAKEEIGVSSKRIGGAGEKGSWLWQLPPVSKENVYTGEELIETVTPEAVAAIFATPSV